jgi:SecD/SecF fusion protein
MEQHNNKLRWIIFAAIMAVAAWKFYPTVRMAIIGEEGLKALDEKAQVELRSQAIKRGLDLQGGMHMVLEVDLVELVSGLARTPDSRFNERMARVKAQTEKNPTVDFWGEFTKEFMDIQLSEYFGERKQENSEIIAVLKAQSDDAVDNSLTILRNRVDGSGLQEPSITKQGQRRIVVELAGVNDPEAARRMIGKTALLEFKLVDEPARTNQVLEAVNAVVKGEKVVLPVDNAATDSTQLAAAPADSAAAKTDAKVAAKTDSAAFDPLAAKTDTVSTAAVTDTTKKVATFFELLTIFQGRNALLVSEENRPKVQAILASQAVKEVIPPTKEFLLGKMEMVGEKPYAELFLLDKEALLTGKALESAGVNINQGGQGANAGAAIVELSMTREGARRFARITGDNVNRRLAIVLDDKVFMAPNIRSKIPNGRAIIEGMESIEEAKELANLLKHGALPSTVKPVEERTVGPSLGAESLQQGAMSALLATLFTVLFMIIYYKLSGVNAIIAMVANIFLMVSALAGFHATLTLPGIAGIVLSIGMAVDANILILERIREELRKGRTVRAAVDAGYTNAMSAIIDSNVTTLIAGVVLYQFGSGPIRGFALTLMIGLVANLYTAIILTRLLFDRFTNYDRATRLSI